MKTSQYQRATTPKLFVARFATGTVRGAASDKRAQRRYDGSCPVLSFVSARRYRRRRGSSWKIVSASCFAYFGGRMRGYLFSLWRWVGRIRGFRALSKNTADTESRGSFKRFAIWETSSMSAVLFGGFSLHGLVVSSRVSVGVFGVTA